MNEKAIKLSLLFFTFVVSRVFNTATWIAEKAQRIKEAKEEAKKEVEKYKQERERQFQEQMKKVWYDEHNCYLEINSKLHFLKLDYPKSRLVTSNRKVVGGY